MTAAMLALARDEGLVTAAMKPVAAGVIEHEGRLVNDDALLLQQQASLDLSYEEINPVLLEAAIAPHLAAQQEGRKLTVDRLAGFAKGLMLKKADLFLMEGAGGWQVPLNDRETMADFVRALQLPVILVVGMRLGCLNHCLLTVQAIRQSGLPLAGWVANCIDPHMPALEENIDTLKQSLAAPCLGVVPWLETADVDGVKKTYGYVPIAGC